MAHVRIDPVTRIEGHLSAELDLDPGWQTNATIADCEIGSRMYRGFENILKDRPPQDPIIICQRI